MITVGLDFGTHQTKVCVEKRNGIETHYDFHQFEDLSGNKQYTLPSIICITTDNKVKYGYIDPKTTGEFKSYFKQAVYRDSDSSYMTLWDAARFSISYIAYILFDLEVIYGEDFIIQMGVPTDSHRIDDRKAIAVSLVASAYKLVDKVFNKNKKDFLNTDYTKLCELTEIVRYSESIKKRNGVLVFPEAYACLMPMIGRGKISDGLNLVVDIGGGTTDISFFTIEKDENESIVTHPQVYDFFSISKGLNYLTNKDDVSSDSMAKSVHIINQKEIVKNRLEVYCQEIMNICKHLKENLTSEYKLQTKLKDFRLKDALKNRPIIYTGGGSTVGKLKKSYEGFCEIHQISYDSWKSKQFDDQSVFTDPSLCPILSTAYGLSISVKNDNIVKKPFRDIFAKIRGYEEDSQSKGNRYETFDYGTDYDACK